MAHMDAEVHTLGTVDAGEPRQLLAREGHAVLSVRVPHEPRRCDGRQTARARVLEKAREGKVHDCMGF